ncbi:MAG: PQQ-binding-like beta-propeller repeat protein [Candidatus Coatesbacteria bacterium]|nr:PQQ-binding-like beta-propeller repeat protein [Candidatus Coatesbacteria bacterium]
MKTFWVVLLIMLSIAFLYTAPGDLRWRYQSRYTYNYSSPYFLDGVVYFASRDSSIYSINSIDGSLRWNYKTGATIYSSPVCADNTVYCGSYDYYLYALNAADGNLRWRYRTGAGIYYSTPFVSNGVVYTGSDDNYIYAINASAGSLVWRYYTSGDTDSSPFVNGTTVYCGSYDTYLYALNTSDGSLRWRYKTSGAVRSSPCAADGTVFVGSNDYYVYAVNESDGSLKWSYRTGNYVYSSPCFVNNTVYIGSNDDYIYALNATDGSLRWRYLTGGDINSSPDVYDGLVSVGCYDRYVYTLNESDGSLAWRAQLGAYIYWSAPCIRDGGLYIEDNDRYFYALYAGVLSLTSPNGGEDWLVGTNHDITWTPAKGNVDIVNIDYSTNSGSTWIQISNASNSAGTYSWTIPNTPSDNCLARVTSRWGTLTDASDAVFKINPGSVQVISPNGGESWEVGTVHNILWSATTNVDTVKIDYSTDNGSNWISVTRAENNGTYSWTIPDTPSPDCLVRVTSRDDRLTDSSDNTFEIYRPAGYKVKKTSIALPIKFSVSPVPFKDRLNISSPTNCCIYDVSGRLIKTLARGKHIVDTNKWSAGVYFIKNEKEIKKTIKID